MIPHVNRIFEFQRPELRRRDFLSSKFSLKLRALQSNDLQYTVVTGSRDHEVRETYSPRAKSSPFDKKPFSSQLWTLPVQTKHNTSTWSTNVKYIMTHVRAKSTAACLYLGSSVKKSTPHTLRLYSSSLSSLSYALSPSSPLSSWSFDAVLSTHSAQHSGYF